MARFIKTIGVLLIIAINLKIALGGGIGIIGDKTILPNVKHKILVLEFDNPINKSWGKDISQMIAQEFLGSMKGIFNMGVVHLQQMEDSIVKFTPENILKISEQQEVLITIWGEFYYDNDDIYVYSHLRIIPKEEFPASAFGLSMETFKPRRNLYAAPPTLQVNFKPIKISIETLKSMHDFYNSTIEVRSDPDSSASVKKVLEPGDTYYVLARDGDWMKIGYGIKSGWVRYRNFDKQGELNEVRSVIDLGQGILQYMAGKYNSSISTIETYLNANDSSQDEMNRCFAHILLGNSKLREVGYKHEIPNDEEISKHYLAAMNAFPDHPSPINHLAIINILKHYRDEAEGKLNYKKIERLLIQSIQTYNDENSLEILEGLYHVAIDNDYLNTQQSNRDYENMIKRQIRLINAISAK